MLQSLSVLMWLFAGNLCYDASAWEDIIFCLCLPQQITAEKKTRFTRLLTVSLWIYEFHPEAGIMSLQTWSWRQHSPQTGTSHTVDGLTQLWLGGGSDLHVVNPSINSVHLCSAPWAVLCDPSRTRLRRVCFPQLWQVVWLCPGKSHELHLYFTLLKKTCGYANAVNFNWSYVDC